MMIIISVLSIRRGASILHIRKVAAIHAPSLSPHPTVIVINTITFFSKKFWHEKCLIADKIAAGVVIRYVLRGKERGPGSSKGEV